MIPKRDAERLHSNLVALRVAAEIRRACPAIVKFFDRPGLPPCVFDYIILGLIGVLKSELQSGQPPRRRQPPGSQPRPATSGPSGKRKSRAR